MDELWIGGQNTDLGGIYCIDESIIQCPMPFFIIRADRDLNILKNIILKMLRTAVLLLHTHMKIKFL